ncbi:hypothetical protein TNCV_2007481 [Trichonephila clavipes]|nr:hypothetical protein TNCV_2007481 [Trichonephila clavipes]
MPKIEDRESLRQLASRHFKLLGRSFPQSSLISQGKRSAHDSPHLSPTPLVLGDNRLARLNATRTLSS